MAAIHLTKENFEEEVLNSSIPVLVDFWATWCGPCQMVGPVIEEIAGEVTDAKVGKVDVDSEPELARKYKVMSIPTLMVFKDGQAVKREVGAKPNVEVNEMLVKPGLNTIQFKRGCKLIGPYRRNAQHTRIPVP